MNQVDPIQLKQDLELIIMGWNVSLSNHNERAPQNYPFLGYILTRVPRQFSKDFDGIAAIDQNYVMHFGPKSAKIIERAKYDRLYNEVLKLIVFHEIMHKLNGHVRLEEWHDIRNEAVKAQKSLKAKIKDLCTKYQHLPEEERPSMKEIENEFVEELSAATAAVKEATQKSHDMNLAGDVALNQILAKRLFNDNPKYSYQEIRNTLRQHVVDTLIEDKLAEVPADKLQEVADKLRKSEELSPKNVPGIFDNDWMKESINPESKEMSTILYYYDLIREKREQDGGEEGQSSETDGNGDHGHFGDGDGDGDGDGEGEEEKNREAARRIVAENNFRALAREAYEHHEREAANGKTQGFGEGSAQDFNIYRKVIVPPLKFKSRLSNTIAKVITSHRRIKIRESRRLDGVEYSPKRVRGNYQFSVIVDTSGSVSSQLNEIMTAIVNLAVNNSYEVSLYFCHSDCYGYYKNVSKRNLTRFLNEVKVVDGGTDLRKAQDLIEEHDPRSQQNVIVITDGYTDWNAWKSNRRKTFQIKINKEDKTLPDVEERDVVVFKQ